MTIVVADLVAKIRADTSELKQGVQSGVQSAKQDLQGVQAQAEQTTRALEIMATQYAKLHGGTATGALEMFTRAGVQPTAASLAQAAQETERLAGTAQRAAGGFRDTAAAVRESVQAVASFESISKALSGAGVNASAAQVQGILAAQGRTAQQTGLAASLQQAGVSANVAAQQAKLLTAETESAAKATAQVSSGWSASESSLVRFGAGLVGINLGISLIAGAARLVHDAIEGIIVSQVEWERSLVTLSGLYGQTGTQAAALATAQANLPGVLGNQQEFAQAAINASALRLRYGLLQQTIDQLTTTGGRVAYATGMTDVGARAQLQQQILAATQTGAPLPPQYGVYVDSEAVARRLGFQGQQALQAYTPQELMQARAAIVSEGLNAFSDRAAANQRAALEAVTRADQARNQAQTAIQSNLERPQTGVIQGPTVAERTLTQQILTGGTATTPLPPTPYGPTAPANIQGLAAIDNERRVIVATERYAVALADSAKTQEDARRTLEQLAHSADAAGARLLSFTGSLEDQTSIAHGDLLAQAQAGVTSRARSAVPPLGMGAGEIGAIARGTGWQQAWQNFVAQMAQQEDTNAIQRNLENQAAMQGPGLESRRTAAQQALAQGPRLVPVQAAMGEAQTRAALVDMATADTQAKLQTISLNQQERQVQLLRETVDLRKLDVLQQQALNAASQNVIRAQQGGLAAQYALSDAQYGGTLAVALAQQRMGRTLQGKDVSGLPSIDQLIQMNVNAQFATAEAAPGALQASRGIEMVQRTATSAGLAQQLTGGQLQSVDLANDLKNLGDLPSQTGLQLELVGLERDNLTIQKELRDLTKDLVNIMKGRPSSMTSSQNIDEIANRVGAMVFGDGGGDSGAPAPSDLPGARRGPF